MSDRRAGSSSGLSVVESLVATVIAVGIIGAALSLVGAAWTTALTQPEHADVQQRLRAAVHAVGDALAGAGAGLDRTPLSGPLSRHLPPVVPYRRGQSRRPSDVAYRTDVVSVMSVASAQAQAVAEQVTDLGGVLAIDVPAECAVTAGRACGFVSGLRILLLDRSGAYDVGTVQRIDGARVLVAYEGALAAAYAAGTVLAHIDLDTFALRPDDGAGQPQLVHYDGVETERPLVDHVVGLAFEYFGERVPPARAPAAWATRDGPWDSTYGPRPLPVDVDDPTTSWGPGETCTFAVIDGQHVPRLATLGTTADLVLLSETVLTDGPWCPDAASPVRFDADLLRIRRVRVRVRAESAASSMRGPVEGLFARPGVATDASRLVPDLEVSLDVAVRNMESRR